MGGHDPCRRWWVPHRIPTTQIFCNDIPKNHLIKPNVGCPQPGDAPADTRDGKFNGTVVPELEQHRGKYLGILACVHETNINLKDSQRIRQCITQYCICYRTTKTTRGMNGIINHDKNSCPDFAASKILDKLSCKGWSFNNVSSYIPYFCILSTYSTRARTRYLHRFLHIYLDR